MDMWSAISICGIWLGVGISSFKAKEAVVWVAVFAFFATLFIIVGDKL